MSDPGAVVAPGRPSHSGVVSELTKGRRTRILGVAISSFAAGACEATFLVLVTRTALVITEGGDSVALPWLGERETAVVFLTAPVLIAARVGLAAVTAWQDAKLSEVTVSDLQRSLTSAFLSSAWPTQRRVAASLQQLVTTFSAAARTLMTSVGRAVSAAANLVAMVLFAFLVDPAGASIVVGAVVALGLMLAPLRRSIRRSATLQSEDGMAFATAAAEISQLGMEVQTFHVGDAVDERLQYLIVRARRSARNVQFLSGLTSPVYTGLAYIGLIGALAVVTSMSRTDTGSMAASLLVMLRSLSYGQGLQGAWSGVASASPPLEVLRARLDELSHGERRKGGQVIDRVGTITATSVSFEYESGAPVLHDLTFTVQPGETIGIVGPSGGGKTSLVQLLLGLYDPTSGSLLLDGTEIRQIDLKVLATKIGFVPQVSNLISGTIAENIRFFRSDIDDAKIERAARLAYIHDDIIKQPDGYASQVGPQGGNLSGGQRQRICIARALASEPEVLILDEPTSALDVQSEHAIRRTLESLRRDSTVIIIAHRLSTLDMCDRIMVVQDGALSAFDSPAELARTAGFYNDALRLSGML
jgi:ATP-binding cassette subfamily B protein